ncbi:hypothetical protein G6F27_012775 [Rhizopus arrhizus]|nr:hypothetical protein G6F27_012775 [Rhizopus arrhizus]KAG1085289.1 hypothetical protein G6F39_012796 [Rhizopus arrhizus]
MRDHLASVYSGSGLPSTRPPPLPSSDDHVPFDLASVSEDDPSGSGLGLGPGLGSGSGSGSGSGLSSFSADSVADTMRRLPLRKAPGSDHLRTEMLIPIRKQVAAILARLFDICCQWSYTPSLWRHAQVVPIYKKGDPHQPSNFRPISLTSIIRKLFEMCLFPHLEDVSPPLDIAQGGFRPQRSALDQALCLHDLIQEYYRRKRHFPVVAFLDIKAAYDTVDRRVIWQSLLAVSAPFALVSVLAHLFDDVSISVLMSNQVSTPFTPSTGVLQGSVLSPHLYSIYINTLPALLRSASTRTTTMVSSLSPSGPPGPPGPGFGLSPGLPFGPTLDVSSLSSSPTAINSLLYADDVAILGSPSEVKQMLDLAQIHSQVLGYRWSPTKCAILNAPDPTSSRYVRLTLYDEDIPSVDEFVYLGVPFVRNGISPSRLVAHRKPGAQLKMAQLSAIGANRSGFSLLFSSRLYAMFSALKVGVCV